MTFDEQLQNGFGNLFMRSGTLPLPMPHRFQMETCKELLAGNSVILRVPTGAGKTNAALFPFLHALKHHLPFPKQMIYSLPLRTLATSLYLEVQNLCESAFPEEEHRPIVTIQTGEMQLDRQLLTGDIIFATYDQTLSSFLTIPVGLSRREGNVNAGAMISSYLVFDEFHLMEANRSLTTMTTMLEWIGKLTPFLLMTATLSKRLTQRLAQQVNAQIVTVSEGDLLAIPSQRDKKRTFQIESRLLTCEDILDSHEHSSIVVYNTVDRAQILFEQLRKEVKRRGLNVELILLHSRFLADDRKKKEDCIREWFGKDYAKRHDAILISTQAIEVGLDLTCEHLHTEIAPAASLIQRAGRCARFPGEQGTVHIYDVPSDNKGNKSYLPYDAKGEPPLCPITWTILEEAYHKRLVGFLHEQELIEAVYDEVDSRILTREALNSRRTEIAGDSGVLTTMDRSSYRELVRFVDSCTFIVHADPESLSNPLRMRTFSISPGTLAHWYHDYGPFQFDEWFARVVAIDKSEDVKLSERYIPPQYTYPCVTEKDGFYKEFLFVINPTFIDYTPDLGLRFMRNGIVPEVLLEPLPESLQDQSYFHYELETYEEHIVRVLQAYIRLFVRNKRLDYVADRIQKEYKVSLDELIRVAIAIHDIGKLSDKWQSWVQIWQRDYKRQSVSETGFYAHTDYDGNADKAKQNRLNSVTPRPPHAAEGAIAFLAILEECFGEKVACLVFTAVVRHHSPSADTVHPFKILPAAQVEAKRVFLAVSGEQWRDRWNDFFTQACVGIREKSVVDLLAIPDCMTNIDFLIYLLIVRALRISDQQSLTQET